MGPGIDVLPSALAQAAAAVRACSRDVQPAVRPVPVSHAALSSALEQFVSRWSIAAAELVDDMDGRARRLTESAQEYSRLESLLVPRALR